MKLQENGTYWKGNTRRAPNRLVQISLDYYWLDSNTLIFNDYSTCRPLFLSGIEFKNTVYHIKYTNILVKLIWYTERIDVENPENSAVLPFLGQPTRQRALFR